MSDDKLPEELRTVESTMALAKSPSNRFRDCDDGLDKNLGKLTAEVDESQEVLNLDHNPIIALDQLVDALWQNAENSLSDAQCVDAQAMAQKLVDSMNEYKSLDNIVFSTGALTAFKSFTSVLTEALEN